MTVGGAVQQLFYEFISTAFTMALPIRYLCGVALVLFALFSISILPKTTNEFYHFFSIIRIPLRHFVRLSGVSHNGKHVMTGERLCQKAEPLLRPQYTKQEVAGSDGDILQSFLMTLAGLPPAIQWSGMSYVEAQDTTTKECEEG